MSRLRDVDGEVVAAACRVSYLPSTVLFQVLSALPSMIGEAVFDTHISNLLPPLRQLYHNIQSSMVLSIRVPVSPLKHVDIAASARNPSSALSPPHATPNSPAAAPVSPPTQRGAGGSYAYRHRPASETS